MRVDAIVVAAGKSTRFGAKIKKPFFPLSGKPILVYCLEVLNQSRLIQNIVLVVPSRLQQTARDRVVLKYHLSKVHNIIAGGKKRQDSVWNGLQVLHNSDFRLPINRSKFRISPRRIRSPDLVLIHDGVRPFITEKMIWSVVAAAQQTGAATIATKVTDTVKLAKIKDSVARTIPREKLWLVQTPQVFQYSRLYSAYQQAQNKKGVATDDAEIAENYGLVVKLVTGSITNIKITTKEDLKIAETILKSQ